jgi:hypothetical protein
MAGNFLAGNMKPRYVNYTEKNQSLAGTATHLAHY